MGCRISNSGQLCIRYIPSCCTVAVAPKNFKLALLLIAVMTDDNFTESFWWEVVLLWGVPHGSVWFLGSSVWDLRVKVVAVLLEITDATQTVLGSHQRPVSASYKAYVLINPCKYLSSSFTESF